MNSWGGQNHKFKSVQKEDIDPRPDLKDDHDLWVALLVRCEQDRDMFGVLHGLRCAGARLETSVKFGLKLLPGEISQEQYQMDTEKYLQPRIDKVLTMFMRVWNDISTNRTLAGKTGEVRYLNDNEAKQMDKVFNGG